MRASTTSILDGSGNCEAAYEYSDFGETISSSDFYNEICYTGGIYDSSTGLYYLNARHYNPEDGRFLTEDTYRGDNSEPNTLHLYAYCLNNPINYVDPSGHWAWSRRLSLMDYRIIHNKVADLSAWSIGKWGGFREVYVKGHRGRGFLDVFDTYHSAYYEVKSLNASTKRSTARQMAKYDVARTMFSITVRDRESVRLITMSKPFTAIREEA